MKIMTLMSVDPSQMVQSLKTLLFITTDGCSSPTMITTLITEISTLETLV